MESDFAGLEKVKFRIYARNVCIEYKCMIVDVSFLCEQVGGDLIFIT